MIITPRSPLWPTVKRISVISHGKIKPAQYYITIDNAVFLSNLSAVDAIARTRAILFDNLDQPYSVNAPAHLREKIVRKYTRKKAYPKNSPMLCQLRVDSATARKLLTMSIYCGVSQSEIRRDALVSACASLTPLAHAVNDHPLTNVLMPIPVTLKLASTIDICSAEYGMKQSIFRRAALTQHLNRLFDDMVMGES